LSAICSKWGKFKRFILIIILLSWPSVLTEGYQTNNTESIEDKTGISVKNGHIMDKKKQQPKLLLLHGFYFKCLK